MEAMEASKVYTPQSLDITFDSNNDEKDINLADLIGEEDYYFSKVENSDFILKTMESLNKIEKEILIDRYFNKKNPGINCKEIRYLTNDGIKNREKGYWKIKKRSRKGNDNLIIKNRHTSGGCEVKKK